MTEKQLTAKMEKHIKLQAKAAQIKKELELLSAQIQTEMDSMDTDVIEISGLTAKRSETLTHRFDSKALKTNDPDIYNAYYLESVRHSFTVKAN